MPDSTEQLAEVVRCCSQASIGVVPYSGGTGVVAGQLSLQSSQVIVLSLKRMNRVREVFLDDAVVSDGSKPTI